MRSGFLHDSVIGNLGSTAPVADVRMEELIGIALLRCLSISQHSNLLLFCISSMNESNYSLRKVRKTIYSIIHCSRTYSVQMVL